MISSSQQMPVSDHVFKRVELYRSGTRVLEVETDCIALPSGSVAPTGKATFAAPMTTTVTLEVDGDEHTLQIRVPIRARTIAEAWAKFDAEIKANYSVGVHNEMIRRGLVKKDPVA